MKAWEVDGLAWAAVAVAAAVPRCWGWLVEGQQSMPSKGADAGKGWHGVALETAVWPIVLTPCPAREGGVGASQLLTLLLLDRSAVPSFVQH